MMMMMVMIPLFSSLQLPFEPIDDGNKANDDDDDDDDDLSLGLISKGSI